MRGRDLVAAFPSASAPSAEERARNDPGAFSIFFRANRHTHRSCDFVLRGQAAEGAGEAGDAADAAGGGGECSESEVPAKFVLVKRTSMEARFLILNRGTLRRLAGWVGEVVDFCHEARERGDVGVVGEDA